MVIHFPNLPRSITSNRVCGLVELYINVVAFASFAVIKFSTSFKRMFRCIDFTAAEDKSFAMICLIPGTSFAYRMLRNPVAESASKMRKPF